MSKGFKKFLLLIIIGLLFTITSCVLEGNSGVNNPSEVDHSIVTYPVYEKNFYASSIEELQEKIKNENSLYTTELKFYYNKAFLEKYNFTLTPDVTNKNEYHYDGERLDLKVYSPYKILVNGSFVFDNTEKKSTPKEVLEKLEKDKYILATNPLYNGHRYSPIYFQNPNEYYSANLTNLYGITYKARTIYPLYQSENSVCKELILRKEAKSVDLCPNYLVPSIEEYDQKLPNGKYQIPVVPTNINFEYILMYGRIYIDNYPIDCIISIKNNPYVNSLENLKEKFVGVSKTDKNTSPVFNIKSKNDFSSSCNFYWTETKDLLCNWSHHIRFFRFETENDIDEDGDILYSRYIHKFDEIYEEYFDTFVEGASEITINYVNHNQ